jgi:uncharacterized membrane protein YqiK
MKKISLYLFSLAAVFTFMFGVMSPVYAADPVDVLTEACKANPNGVGCENGKPATGSGLFTIIKTIIQVMIVIGGIIAVIMIILGGIRYITSNGDQADVKAAKDTILYAVVGLVVTIISYAIVYYVTRSI